MPVEGGLVAEPPLGSPIVQLLSVLPSELSELYSQPDRLFRPHEEASGILRFMGPKDEYTSYMARPTIRPLWRLALASSSKGRCSFARVPKRTGKELRKILQVCSMNDAMWDVEHCIRVDPQYGLQGGGALP